MYIKVVKNDSVFSHLLYDLGNCSYMTARNPKDFLAKATVLWLPFFHVF